MKVILLADVAQIGQKHDVVEVPRGHALNYLIPRRLGEPVTKQNARRVEQLKAERARANEEAHAAFGEMLGKLGSVEVTISAPANEQGHLYEGIHVTDIAAHLERQGMPVKDQDVVLSEPIKEVGTHVIDLVRGEQEGRFTLTVEASS